MTAAQAAHWIAPDQHLYGEERTELDNYEVELVLPEGGERLARSFPPVHSSLPCSTACWLTGGNDPLCTLTNFVRRQHGTP